VTVANLRAHLKRITPETIWKPASQLYWRWHNRGRHQMAGTFHPAFWNRHAQLKRFRDKHQGQRCFIIGNGPSLRKMDLSYLKDEITFGLNRIYILFPELGFHTTYFVAINTLVLEQCAREIQTLPMPKFITWRGRHWIDRAPDVIFLDTDYTGPPTFSRDVSQRVFEGSTVTYVAMQVAFHMGFSEVVLIGVDHRFQSKGRANETVISQGADQNHFSPEYFSKGFRWQLPDLEASEAAYRTARVAFEKAERKIIDATVGGKLMVFPKEDYLSLFNRE
jgi:hypothetical protein